MMHVNHFGITMNSFNEFMFVSAINPEIKYVLISLIQDQFVIDTSLITFVAKFPELKNFHPKPFLCCNQYN